MNGGWLPLLTWPARGPGRDLDKREGIRGDRDLSRAERGERERERSPYTEYENKRYKSKKWKGGGPL